MVTYGVKLKIWSWRAWLRFFVVSMDLLYHFFIISSIFFLQVSELNSKSSIGRTLSDDVNIETDNLENGVYWITPSTLGNPSGSYGRLVKMDNYKMFVSASTTSGVQYGRKLWLSIYANNEWTPFTCFSDDATVLGQTINASDILADIISDISEMDDINETCIRYVQGALLEGKSIYGFVLTAKAGTVLSQIIFGSFTGVSGMAVRGKSGSPIQWKDWKIL